MMCCLPATQTTTSNKLLVCYFMMCYCMLYFEFLNLQTTITATTAPPPNKAIHNKIYEQKNIIYDSLLCCCSTNNTERKKRNPPPLHKQTEYKYIVYLQPFEFASDIYGLCVLNTPEPLHDKCLCIHYIDSHKFIIKIKIHQQNFKAFIIQAT